MSAWDHVLDWHEHGQVTRIRVEAEANSLRGCEKIIDHTQANIWEALRERGLVPEGHGEFGEATYESIITEMGAIHYRGRRAMKVAPMGLEGMSEEEIEKLATGNRLRHEIVGDLQVAVWRQSDEGQGIRLLCTVSRPGVNDSCIFSRLGFASQEDTVESVADIVMEFGMLFAMGAAFGEHREGWQVRPSVPVNTGEQTR